MFLNTNKIIFIKKGVKKLKTFNFESNCIRYKDCYFDIGEYEKGKLELAIYGYIENDKNISHISNITVNVEEKLPENQIVIDNYSNSNLISFLMELGIVKRIIKRIAVKFIMLPVVEINLDVLKEYSYDKEVLKYAS